MTTLTKNPRPVLSDDPNIAKAAEEILHQQPDNRQVIGDLMEIKKYRKAQEEANRPLFFWIGMSISLLLVLIAFNWKTYDNGPQVDLGELDKDFTEIIDVPVSSQPPPPPPQKNLEVFEIVEVENEVEIEEIDLNLDMEVTEEEAIADVVFEVKEAPVETVEEVFTIVETFPEPEGGIATFYDYVAENIKYPAFAKKMDVSGIVFVRFVVEKDGDITDVQVIKGIGAGCDEEAIRVVDSAPNWKPGKQRGKAVRVSMTVPIRFILRN